MKKMIKFLTVFTLIISLFGCGNSSTDENDDSSVKVDEGLIMVDITLDRTFFEGMSDQDIIDAAEEEGYSKCSINEDGSVVYTMTKSKQKEMLSEMKKSIEESIAGTLEGENKVDSFVKVDYNDKLTEFTVFIDSEKYTDFDVLQVFGFFIQSVYYQTFSGEKADDIDVKVEYIDNETNEVIFSNTYKEYLEELEESEGDK